MKITSIEQSVHRLELNPPFQPSWDTRLRSHFDIHLVRVETGEGLVGIGSGDAMPGFEGHEDLFLGRDPRDLERHFRVIENLSFHYGRCWPLDIALWDLFGQITGQPCWRLLGGRSDGIRAYASSGSPREPEELVDLAQLVVEEGYAALKIRFHRKNWQDDLEALAAVRDAVGDSLELMVDCNQGWRMPWDTKAPWTLKQAMAVARELEHLDVYWMEEPLHRGDYEGMRLLRENTSIRIAGAEMTRELHELRELIDRGCLDVLQPDAAVTGGITGLRRIAQQALDRGLEFTPHTWGNGIGLLANAHLAAGCGGSAYLEFPFDPPAWTPERRDFPMVEPLIAGEDGWIALGEAPGLGIELDEDMLEATRIQ
ncbi:MAG TPA: mandelate racemase/muconate lactonizing enzyme family protein [Kiloniellales bacterium]|nr:mandelate racemase/muconate lactonizing enzyme family protein [Kiloniellales bacterium]